MRNNLFAKPLAVQTFNHHSIQPKTRFFVRSALGLALAAAPQINAWAATTDTDVEEMLVTASPLAKSRDAINQAVASLSGNQLRERAASTLGETLNGLPGVSSASFGPGVGLPIIRGQSDNRVKVMQDSIGTMDASAASPDHAVTAEALLASRIEVLRGPAALRYGSGAIGGVVNVLDNRIPEQLPDGIEGGVELRYGSASDETAAVASATGAAGDFAWHLDGVSRDNNNLDIPGRAARDPAYAEQTSNGYIANTDAQAHSETAGLSYIGDSGFLGLALSQEANNYGIPLDPAEDESVRIDMQQTRVDLKGRLLSPIDGIAKVDLRLGHNDYQHTEMEDGQPGTRFTNNAWEGRIEAVHQKLGEWQGAIGLQLAQRDFAALGEEAFIPRSDISNQGIFIVEERKIGAWQLELGARAEQQKINPDQGQSLNHSSSNFSASASWHFSPNQRATLSLAQSQRAPSVEELLADGPHPATGAYLLGDTGLNRETSHNLELGYHWHSELISASVNAYYNDIGDFIYARATGAEQDGLKQFRYSQTGATFKGVEIETNIHLSDNLSLRLFGDSVNARLDDGSYVPRVPPKRYGSELRYTLERWSASLSASHASAQEHPGTNEEPTASYTRVDANISYHWDAGANNYLVFLKGGNLTNSEIRNASSFLRDIAPEAGRNIQLGVRVSF